jgi:hypothetical protein
MSGIEAGGRIWSRATPRYRSPTMIVYALLGSSRVLSVSSTATLAILVGTQLGLVVPAGDPEG